VTLLTLTNARPVARFAPTPDSSHDWTFPWPQGAGSSARATVYFIADGTAGCACFKASVEAITPSDTVDLDAVESFDTASSSGGISLPATAGQLARADIVLASVDSVAAGDYVRLRLTRDTAVAGNASANVDVLGVVVEKL
jgi:hypothetical protein